VSDTTTTKLELVREAIDALNRRDTEAMLALADDDFEYDWTRSIGPNRGVYLGREGFLEFLGDQWSMFNDFRVDVHELVPRGEHVVASITVHVTGRDGISLQATSAHLYTFEGERLVQITLFQELPEALDAAVAR
jgi:ketosteroid isomerase-like protein